MSEPTPEDPRLLDRDALVAELVATWAESGYEAPEVLIESTVDAVLARLEAVGAVVDLSTPEDPDQAGTGQVRTLCDVPEDGFPTAVVEVCKYIDAETGTEHFLCRFGGDASTSEVLALLEAGKFIGLGLWPHE